MNKILKNILIITENFIYGGLETQIAGQVKYLNKNGVKCYLLCRRFESNLEVPFADIVPGFNFSHDLTCLNLVDLVNQLTNYIKKNEIELIHAHPFFSFMPAALAAYECNIPMVYTIHGPASINFLNHFLNGDILNKIFLSDGVDKIFNVGEYLNAEIGSYDSKKKMEVLKNSVDTALFKESKFPDNKKWALVSRLDSDKIESILDFLKILNKTPIKSMDIYGSGTDFERLKSFLNEQKLENKVNLMGKSENLHNDLLNNYDGVIGMGRVVIETLSMNLPAILLSYKGIVAAIDEQNIYNYSTFNFSGRGASILNDEEKIASEFYKVYDNLEKYQLRDIIVKDFNEENIWEYFLETVAKLKYEAKPMIKDLFYLILCALNKESYLQSKELFSRLILRFPEYCNIGLNSKINKLELDFNSRFNLIDLDYRNKILNLEATLIEATKTIENMQAEKEAVYNSTSWKITKPMRKIKVIIKELFKKQRS